MIKSKSKSKAFSLIELSIVILVIGILIAGVTQGSALILKAKLKTAQALTQSSPVSAISGLRLWLETTLEQSFEENQASDGTTVTIWYDINPQVSSKLFARSAGAVKYKEDVAINSLPSLYFPSELGDFFTISTNKTATVATAIPTENNAFSFFVVAQADAIGAVDNLFFNGTSNGWGYANGDANKTVFNADTAITGAVAKATAEIISVTNVGGTTGALKSYVNGVIDISATSTFTSPTGGLYIGSGDSTGSTTDNWKGYISEIIIFDKKLSNTDRRAVEEYLGKKYNIQVATS
jgi:prepilin-type N-terminal cleavage/methylation domain-containing protein